MAGKACTKEVIEMSQVLDVEGLHNLRPNFIPQKCKYDTIMKKTFVVVKNVCCGLNSAEFDHHSGKFEDGSWRDYDLYTKNDLKYSIAVPEKICFKGFDEPDLTDGGYQHPLSEDWIDDVAKKATNNGSRYGKNQQYDATWDRPNTSGKRNLRYYFKTEKQAEKFIKLMERKISKGRGLK